MMKYVVFFVLLSLSVFVGCAAEDMSVPARTPTINEVQQDVRETKEAVADLVKSQKVLIDNQLAMGNRLDSLDRRSTERWNQLKGEIQSLQSRPSQPAPSQPPQPQPDQSVVQAGQVGQLNVDTAQNTWTFSGPVDLDKAVWIQRSLESEAKLRTAKEEAEKADRRARKLQDRLNQQKLLHRYCPPSSPVITVPPASTGAIWESTRLPVRYAPLPEGAFVRPGLTFGGM